MVIIDAIVPGTPTQSVMIAILSLVERPCEPPLSVVVPVAESSDVGVGVGVVVGEADD